MQEKTTQDQTQKETQPTTTPYSSKNIPTITEIPIEAPSFLFKGFDDISLFTSAYWKYSWKFTSTTSSTGSEKETKSGTILIELTDSEVWNLKELGKMTFYRTKYTFSGDEYPLHITQYQYLAAKEGAIYGGQYEGSNNVAVVILFDSRNGYIYKDGFIGYFSDDRKKSANEVTFNNRPAVVVSEPFYKPECQTIAGVETCDNEFHDYDVREYYVPHVGFGGFYRSGTSIFSGGGYVTIHTSTMDMRFTDTNIIQD